MNSGTGQPGSHGLGNAFGQNQQQFGNSAPGESMIPQKVQSISQNINAGGSGNDSKSAGGLFTDLDPLGSGKSKPYMDKKDFFRAEKEATSPKLTGRKASNGGLSSPAASGPVPLNGASSAAPASTNSPAPSLDALTNSVGSMMLEPKVPTIVEPHMEKITASPQ